MPQRSAVPTASTWWERIEPWLHQQSEPAQESAQASTLTDAEIIAAWTPVTQTRPGQWRFNPMLDLPLKPYAGMDKNKLWEMFLYRLAESETQNILQAEQSWAESLERHSIDIDSAPPPGEAHNKEAPLRPSDLAASVVVWLWHNGLRHEAIGVFLQIWQSVRHRQEHSPQPRIPWPAESALEGFRVAAYRDWDDNDQAEFAALFHERFVVKEIERGLESLIN